LSLTLNGHIGYQVRLLLYYLAVPSPRFLRRMLGILLSLLISTTNGSMSVSIKYSL
jgi:hypothetical protein